jgi:hypothetical protein
MIVEYGKLYFVICLSQTSKLLGSDKVTHFLCKASRHATVAFLKQRGEPLFNWLASKPSAL